MAVSKSLFYYSRCIMKKQLLLVLLAAGAFDQVCAMNNKNAYTPLSSVRSAKRPAVDRLIEMTFDKDLMLTSMRASLDAIKSRSLAAGQPVMSPEMDALTSNFQDKIAQEMFSENTINKIKELYTKVYTEQEIEELVRFYESAVGQKTLKSLPEISVQVMGIMGETMQKHMNDYLTQVSQLNQKAQEGTTTK